MAAREVNGHQSTSTTTREPKKRRVQGSCDLCRRKKVKCDSARMPNNRCTNCTTAQLNCTHFEAIKNWGPARGYIENLENRVKLLEDVLQKLVPNIDLNRLSDITKCSFDSEMTPREHPWIAPSTLENTIRPISLLPNPSQSDTYAIPSAHETETEIVLHEGDTEPDSLLDKLHKLTLDPTQHRFCGESSGVNFVKTAYKMKTELTRSKGDMKPPELGSHRPEFWTNPLWDAPEEEEVDPGYKFPAEDLRTLLVDLYFVHVNQFTPLLHRQTFERAVQDQLHLRDHMFGATLLLVCSLGSHFCDDPRVFLEGNDSPYSRGWKWFSQVQVVRTNLHPRVSLYELQKYSLWIMFGRVSFKCKGCWVVAGTGLRMALEVGAHRRKPSTKTWTVEDELWKRAFWVLFFIDRGLSTILGRPCALADEDIDLDLPVECDDEFWEISDSKLVFRQPPGQPSTVAYFNFALKLRQISGLALRTIYCVRKLDNPVDSGMFSDQHVIAELDSALNKWVDSVPDHLRWDPHRENQLFFNQSAALYANYYHVQILVHKPFISAPGRSSFPSLAICTNAARLCSHVVDVQRCRNNYPLPQIQNAAFQSGIVLLLNIWSGKRSGLSVDPSRDIDGLQKCMNYLKVCETRRSSSGRCWDILSGLAFAGDLSLESPPPSTNKRLRDEEDSDDSTGSSFTEDIPRVIAGSRRVISKVSQEQDFTQQNMFALPTHTSELGRLPVYGQGSASGESTYDPQWFADLLSAPQVQQGHEATTFPSYLSRAARMAAQNMTSGQFMPQYGDAAHFPNEISHDGSTHLQNGDADTSSYTYTSLAPTPQNDAMSVWINTPLGIDMEGWGSYITNVDSLTRNPGNVGGSEML